MANNNLSILFFLFTFFILLSLVFTHPRTCSTKFCKPGEPGIRYPFRLKQLQPDERCAFPGFDLLCNGQNRTTLTLPLLGEFIVDSIDYVGRVIRIGDPDDCLPKRLHNFTTASQWMVQQYSNFTFFKCPMESRALHMFTRESCLDSHNYNVVVVATDKLAVDWINLLEELRCNYSQTISIPTIDNYFTRSGVTYPSSIHLTWNEPSDCIGCEAIIYALGSEGKKGFEAGCPISPSYHGGENPKGDTSDHCWIILGIGVPCFLCIVNLIACKLRARRLAQQDQTNPSSPPGRAQALVIISGRDTPMIESYPTTYVGDAGGLMPWDNNCSICLSEYKPKEVLWTLPECKHSFHAHCIDPWLKRNACCLLCRNDQGYARSAVSTQEEGEDFPYADYTIGN